MARLLSWPAGVHWTSREPLAGPRTVGAASTESVTGHVQTVASPFGLWRWQFSLPPLRGEAFRAWRGTVTALHGGANALRVPFCDPDGMSWAEIGVTVSADGARAGAPWSNGLPWREGPNWRIGRPTVPLATAPARGDTVIALVDAFWGHKAGLGVMIGFAPFHFGLYTITEAIGHGRYRIWPPLRADIAPTQEATLAPVLAMRLESESAATAGRGAAFAEGLTATFVEVTDDLVRAHFTD